MYAIDNHLAAAAATRTLPATDFGDFQKVAAAIDLNAIDEIAYPVVPVTGIEDSYTNAIRALFDLTGVPYFEVPAERMRTLANVHIEMPLVYVGHECVGHSLDVFAEFMSGKFQQRLVEHGVSITSGQPLDRLKLIKAWLPFTNADTANMRTVP